MTSRISRRTAAKLLLSASAIAALPKSAVAKEAPKPAGPALTPSERQKLAKSITQLRGAVGKIRALKIPMGTEPAFVFRPLSGKR
jgi:hypothetical protein